MQWASKYSYANAKQIFITSRLAAFRTLCFLVSGTLRRERTQANMGIRSMNYDKQKKIRVPWVVMISLLT